MRDTAGSAAAPAARWRKFRRGSFILNLPPFTSFDHLVGAGEHGSRNVEAERFGSLEVNYKFVFSRCLHRQVGRLLALDDTIHIAGRALVLVDLIRPVGGEATPAGIGSVSQATKNAQAARDARNESVQ